MLRAGVLAVGVSVGVVGSVTWTAAGQVLEKDVPEEMRGLELVDRLGERAALDVALTDSSGRMTTLASYVDGSKPVLLVLAYYDCPMLCTLVLTKLQKVMNELDYTAGEDFRVVVVSFDHTNTASMAAEKREGYLAGYARELTPTIRAGWEFFVGSQLDVRRLADSVGFPYRYLEDSGEFAHPSTFVVLTPEGVVSRYVSGLEYTPKHLKLALLEATDGKIGRSIGDFFLHFCFRYDPSAGAYNVESMAVMRLAGAASIVGVAGLVGVLLLGERRRRRRRASGVGGGLSGVAGGIAA